jgi:uncharacterized protein YegP (UPF0339 family)
MLPLKMIFVLSQQKKEFQFYFQNRNWATIISTVTLYKLMGLTLKCSDSCLISPDQAVNLYQRLAIKNISPDQAVNLYQRLAIKNISPDQMLPLKMIFVLSQQKKEFQFYFQNRNWATIISTLAFITMAVFVVLGSAGLKKCSN